MWLATALALVAVLAGCAGLGRDVTPPDVYLVNLRPVSLGLFEQRLALDLRVQNPNDFALRLDGLRFDLDLDGVPFARGVSDRDICVPALGEGVVPVTVSAATADVVDRALELARGGALPYELSGQAILAGPFGIPVPFRHVGEVRLLPSRIAPLASD
jgi:LEA14-like dessication related protein